MTTAKPQPAPLRRFIAAAAVRGMSLATLAARCAVTPPHLRACIVGERRWSDRVAAAAREHLGDAGWRFAMGHADALPMPGTGEASP